MTQTHVTTIINVAPSVDDRVHPTEKNEDLEPSAIGADARATLDAVLGQTRRVDSVVLVSTPDTDEKFLGTLNDALVDADVEFRHLTTRHYPYDTATSDELGPEIAGTVREDQWLWFVDALTVPEPDALEHLMTAVELSPSVTVAGAKQVEADQPRHLVDVGLSVTNTGEPMALIEPGEIDQGQYDHRSDVFAVSAPGMLVRADVWEALNGVDDHAPEAALAADVCWRARLAGHRVVVVPQAVVRRADHPAEEESVSNANHASTWMRLKHRSGISMVLTWIWVLLAGIGGFFASLFIKAPGAGLAQLGGKLRALTRPIAMGQSRAQAARSRQRPYSAVDELRVEPMRVRNFKRSLIDSAEPEVVIGDGTGATGQESQPTGGNDDFEALATPDRSWVGLGLVAAILILGAVSIVGFRQLFGAEAISGGNLVPASSSLRELFSAATSGWVDAGLGVPGATGPFSWILVLLGLTGNASVALSALMILAMPLAGAGAWTALGSVTRSRAARFALAMVWGFAPVLLVSISDGRIGAVLAHLLLPWLAMAVIRAVGAAPHRRLDFTGTRNTVAQPGRGGTPSWTASAWVALLLAAVTASAPSLLIPLLLILIALMILGRQRAKTLWWTPLLTLALFVPVIFSFWNSPRAIFADPGRPVGYLPGEPLHQLLGFPQNIMWNNGLGSLPWLDHLNGGVAWAGIAVVVIAAPLIVLALIGLFNLNPVGRVARVGAGVSVVGLLTGALIPYVLTAVDQQGILVSVFTGGAVSLTWLGLMLAAASGIEWCVFGAKKLVPVITVVATITSLLAATLWIIPRTVGPEPMHEAVTDALTERIIAGAEPNIPLEPLVGFNAVSGVPQSSLPATAADQAESKLAIRTLVLDRTTEGIRAQLVTGEGLQLQDLQGPWTTRGLTGSLFSPEIALADEADEALRTLAAELISGSTTDPRPILEMMGIGFVVLADADGSQTTAAAQIDSVTGLAPVGPTDPGWLWRVMPENTEGAELLDGETSVPQGTNIARARITDSTGVTLELLPFDQGSNQKVSTTIPEASDGKDRFVVVSQRPDSGWRATLDGKKLETHEFGTSVTWVQAFKLPETGGHLEINFSPAVHWLYWIIPAGLFIIALLLGIPSPRRRARTTRDAPTQTVKRQEVVDAA